MCACVRACVRVCVCVCSSNTHSPKKAAVSGRLCQAVCSAFRPRGQKEAEGGGGKGKQLLKEYNSAEDLNHNKAIITAVLSFYINKL